MDRARVFGGVGALVFALAALRSFGESGPIWQLHVALALTSLVTGAAPQARARPLAAGLGTFLLAFALLAIFSPTLFGLPARIGLPLRAGWKENATHLVMGAWGVHVGTQKKF